MKARFYPGGLSRVRGLFLNGRKVFYRTEAEQNQQNADELAESVRLDHEKFEKSRDDMDKRYAALPGVFRDRLDRLRSNNHDFRWRYEQYELFCCEQAVAIASHVPNMEAWLALPFDKQKSVVTELSDQHSGNTFGCAVALAKAYLAKPSRVVRMHGALCPLVGCADYGCIAPNNQGTAEALTTAPNRTIIPSG